MNQHEILVLAGPGGSKSTFVWAFYNYVNYYTDQTITYSGIEGNVSDDFQNEVINPMSKRNEFPGQTYDGYVVELKIGGGSSLISDLTVKFVDYPGERIGNVLRSIMDDIREGSVDWDRIHSNFESSLKAKIGGDEAVKPSEWKDIILHYYDNATKVMFLLNIYKLYVEDDDPVYEADDLQTVSEDKVRTALVPTAVDLIDCNPDETDFDTGGWIRPSPQMIDKELLNELSTQITGNPTVTNMLNEVERNEQIDFFGTAVPAKKNNPKQIQRGDQAPFRTQGYAQVIEWIKD